jgi:hypothetical protein
MTFIRCQVEGCDGNAHWSGRGHRGLCSRHYQRKRIHGSPLGGGTARGEPRAYLEGTVLPFTGDDCLIWPYAKIGCGYGNIFLDGANVLVTRIACEHRNGPPPTAKHHAAHSCGNGHLGCCNPNHLRWATAAENNADQLIHGTRANGDKHPRSKLSAVEVSEIKRRLSTGESQARIADDYSVQPHAIWMIAAGINWKHVA